MTYIHLWNHRWIYVVCFFFHHVSFNLTTGEVYMSRITLEEFVEENELKEINDLPEEELAEQEQVAQSETLEAGSETEELIANQERSIDTVEALEALREAMESKGQLSETDLKLMRIATEMAVAGTGFTITSVVPSLESNDPKLALEGFSDRIKSIVVKIGENISRIFQAIKNFFATIVLSFRSMAGRTKKLLAKAKAIQASGKTKADDITIKYRDIFIVGDGNRIKDLSQFTSEYKTTMSAIDKTISTITVNAKYNAQEYGVLATIKDLAKIEETGKKFYTYVDDLMHGVVKDMKMKKVSSIRNCDVYVAKDNLGGYGFEIRIPGSGHYDRNNYKDLKKSLPLFKFYTDSRISDQERNSIDTSPMTIKTVSIKSIIGLLEDTLSNLSIEIKHLDKLTELYNAASYRAEGAIRTTINIFSAAVGFGAAHTFNKLAAAHSVKVVMGGEEVGKIAGGVALGTSALLDYTLFSFRAMSKNNSLIYDSVNNCFHLFNIVTKDTIWSVNEILNKGRWQ